MCVHGLTRNGQDFDTLATALVNRFRILCPDMPGRGDSEWLSDPNDYAFPTYLGTLSAMLAHAHAERVAWVGTSMGGLLGMVMAEQQTLVEEAARMRRQAIAEARESGHRLEDIGGAPRGQPGRS